LSKRATHLIGKDSIAFNLNLEKYGNESVSSVHFSASGKTALLYASQKGGEMIKNLAARCRELASAEHGLFSAAEVAEIQSILARYESTNNPAVASFMPFDFIAIFFEAKIAWIETRERIKSVAPRIQISWSFLPTKPSSQTVCTLCP
jgi:hypothetical protein